jgi:tetratricopeptide (TPR) repeat protein
MVHYQRDEFYRALSAVSRAVAEKPDDARGHNHLAAVNKALGWTTAAEAELQKALDLDPGYAEAHFNLALLYLERKPPAVEMARRHYLQAVELGAPGDELVEKQLKEFADDENLEVDKSKPTGTDTESAVPKVDKAGSPGPAPRTEEKAKPKNNPRRNR